MRRIAVTIVVAILAGQVALTGIAFTRADAPDQLTTPIHPSTEPDRPVDFEGVWLFASKVAADWRSDAKLVRATMQIDWPLEPQPEQFAELPQGGWILLAFLSKGELLTMRLDRGSGTIVETRLLALVEASRDAYAAAAIDFEQASTTSGTAARAADAAYGSEYRAACPEMRFVSWLTVAREPVTGQPVWRITYETRAEEPQPSMMLDVDWQTGDILNVTNATADCG